MLHRRFTTLLLGLAVSFTSVAISVENAFSAPRPTRRITEVCERRQVKGWLYKPESQDTRDSREGKPVMIFTKYKPAKYSLRAFATNGVVIARFKYFKGTEVHGRRFYSGTGTGYSGSQLAAAARRASGSSNVYFEGAGDNCAGPVNPSKRNDRR